MSAPPAIIPTKQPTLAGTDALSPAMRQYLEQKQRVGDAVLLFRMGDFYETFYDDAILCSKVLGIALTSRNKNDAHPIPLAGIPYHALDSYLGKLVAAGHRVAVSEQMEDPKLAKGVIRRDVVRIVTAGTLTEDALLDHKEVNSLVAVCIRGDQAGIALVELAGGRFETLELSASELIDHLVRLGPAEVLLDEEASTDRNGLAQQIAELTGATVTRRPSHEFAPYQAERTLLEHFQTATLAGFGFDRVDASLCAAGCAIQYLRETQLTALRHLTALRRRKASSHVQIDHASWRSLEIERTLRGGEHEGGLLHAMDRTVHPMGARVLRQRLCAPLTDRGEIERRWDAVGSLAEDGPGRERIRQRLRHLADIERIGGRIALGRCSPRDLSALSRTLAALPPLAELVSQHFPPILAELVAPLTTLGDVADLLKRSIRDEPSNNLREGGFIAEGFEVELDRLRAIGRDGDAWLADYQRREIERTGITNLKAGFNRVFGYYLEISHSAKEKVPPEYVRKQTVKNAERYITEELKNHETEVLTAEERANALEFTLFERVRERLAGRLDALLRAADAIGRLDCAAGLAELAATRRYVRPVLVDEVCLDIRSGRHPVLDQILGDAFVPNDTMMTSDAARLFIITGPNMAGKSTYIRQTALLVLMAQVGSFVPAESMTFSLIDRLFARVGSSDEIMRGQSTFMVEMTEAAHILHHATQHSLVILDELGRGTSTFDGLSLAWAITEHLAGAIRCRSLVATHYHELTELAELILGVKNFNVVVREYPAAGDRDGGIIFLHRIVEGAASQSYGIHVARLAGIPPKVIARSREVLDELQQTFARESHSPKLTKQKTRRSDQLPLFRDPSEDILADLRKVDPDQMTPLQAMQKLQKWKSDLGDSNSVDL